jgi:hypothetical protein
MSLTQRTFDSIRGSLPLASLRSAFSPMQ